MRESGEALVAELGITKGMKVLDLGCGDGTTAMPEARLGADVLGVDIAQQPGRRRATSARGRWPDQLPVSGRRCVQSAGLPDKRFDLVVSIFGAMFAPRPFDVAKEMVRVTRPGGRIVMGNWIPERSDAGRADPEDQLGLHAAAARRLCQPDDVGRREQCDRALRRGRSSAEQRSPSPRDTYTFNCPGTPADSSAEFRNYYGPTMNAFEAAEKNGRAADLQKELEDLFKARTRARRTDDH